MGFLGLGCLVGFGFPLSSRELMVYEGSLQFCPIKSEAGGEPKASQDLMVYRGRGRFIGYKLAANHAKIFQHLA